MEFYANLQKVISKEKEQKEKYILPKVLFEDQNTKERETLIIYNDNIYNLLDENQVYDLTAKKSKKGYIEIIDVNKV